VEVVEVLSASSVLVRPADADSPPADDAGDGRTQP
jgi:hypothetical protein